MSFKKGRQTKQYANINKWIQINSTTKIKSVIHMNPSGVLLLELYAHHELSITPCFTISWDIRSIAAWLYLHMQLEKMEQSWIRLRWRMTKLEDKNVQLRCSRGVWWRPLFVNALNPTSGRISCT